MYENKCQSGSAGRPQGPSAPWLRTMPPSSVYRTMNVPIDEESDAQDSDSLEVRAASEVLHWKQLSRARLLASRACCLPAAPAACPPRQLLASRASRACSLPAVPAACQPCQLLASRACCLRSAPAACDPRPLLAIRACKRAPRDIRSLPALSPRRSFVSWRATRSRQRTPRTPSSADIPRGAARQSTRRTPSSTAILRGGAIQRAGPRGADRQKRTPRTHSSAVIPGVMATAAASTAVALALIANCLPVVRALSVRAPCPQSRTMLGARAAAHQSTRQNAS